MEVGRDEVADGVKEVGHIEWVFLAEEVAVID